jgi:hypothetical protein
MCLVSDKIKLCTCADVDDLEALDSYWILYQPDEDKEEGEFIIGTCVTPTAYRDPNFALNENILLERLNDGEAFDKPFQFSKKDRLQVVIQLDNDRESFSYNFEYSGRKWKSVVEDVFELENNYILYRQGRIK